MSDYPRWGDTTPCWCKDENGENIYCPRHGDRA